MPKPSFHPSRNSFQPATELDTYRDLLLFEERLKTNAAALQRRKYQYQLFLVQLLLAIVFLSSEVLLETTFLSVSYRHLLRKAIPGLSIGPGGPSIHPYVAPGLLFVSVTALLLFFASGVYSEKIAYANRYVPHANKALRSFNMYLNMRQPPLRSRFSFLFKPWQLFFARPPADTHNIGHQSRPSSPTKSGDRNASVPISPIPPTNNPRGELIFSSRVDRNFRESYERHRALFERRRDEREREEAYRTWLGWVMLHLRRPWRRTVTAETPASAVPPGALASRTSSIASRTGAGSTRSTPNSSRRSSPIPRSHRRMVPSSRSSTPDKSLPDEKQSEASQGNELSA
ncbi:hypothetical protein CONPUDRAFT_170351 [Coniophora puteana RWD-64-598 SS2]|uniref:Transmembrane protein 188 n=1 Tax=Coniophora puteana (strain RWD-64-598) TaxID=741705 RepID=R7SD13_CONPW|nr:uncharacterized protein CONPUDRAFT_170351 [Coniophora puteana RWD-64-598 SS2]EIW74066.1 hypothetical protein CONPUDRAFT_170351 [Coniophora puteana RWD-64-598 SS2]